MAALLLAALLGLGPAAASPAAPGGTYGILLLAHGGDRAWNQQLLGISRKLDGVVPTEAALGMADPGEIQAAVDRLQARRVAKIVAVPLFVNSASEVLDQTRYVLGMRAEPSAVLREALARFAGHAHGPHGPHGHHGFSVERAKIGIPAVLTPALDDHPLLSAVLLERARELSRKPSRETVILVGHGPVDEAANAVWLRTMDNLARRLARDGGFRAVRAATLRDDSADDVKAGAARELRALVGAAGADSGRAIVIPYLIARGGIEDHIVRELDGLSYEWNGKTICPHVNIELWVSKVAAEGARQDDMRRYK